MKKWIRKWLFGKETRFEGVHLDVFVKAPFNGTDQALDCGCCCPQPAYKGCPTVLVDERCPIHHWPRITTVWVKLK